MKARPMIVAGIMSGTSADGIDVAVVRISEVNGRYKLKLLAHEGFAYPAELRASVLGAMNAQSISAAELAQLNWRLGIAYADAVKKTLVKHPHKVELIGCHGQTIYHQATKSKYIGKSFSCTWQLGEAAVVAQETGIAVVANFRPADMAVDGQGAPLVPFLDYALFADKTRGRVLQNIGGIANMTVIPAGAKAEDAIAFDCGPGNMVMDALMSALFNRVYDADGEIAAQGKVLESVLKSQLRNKFFSKRPPKTAGREEFGREYSKQFIVDCLKISKRPEDAVATATALTTEAITAAFIKFCLPKLAAQEIDFIVSGGGAKNRTLMQMLALQLCPLGCELRSSDEFGLPAEAKEAAAFALLAYETWHKRTSNLTSATGAKRPVILGQVSYV